MAKTKKELPSIFDVWKVVQEERIKDPPEFALELGQRVRIRVKLDSYWPEEDSWKGKVGTIIKRYESGISFRGDNVYHVQIGRYYEPFKEFELDHRYCKKKTG